MFDAGLARAGRLRIPTHPGLVFDFLPTAWRTVQHYGVEIHGLRYNGTALSDCRNRTSPFTGTHAGKWPVRYDPDDASTIYFCDPDDREQVWHELAWEHADDIGAPFSTETLAYARRLALASGRHVDARRALAELLDRWDAGLVRHPAERRMAIRASQQRQARLEAATPDDATAQIATLPTVAAITAADDPTTPMQAGRASPAGDDDSVEELDIDDDANDVDAPRPRHSSHHRW
jgi:hypothetical protein